MNSLEELNQWNLGTSVTYTDQRIAGVYFDRAAAVNQSVIANEGSTFISPVGIEITDIANNNITLLTYTIDISNAPTGTTVSWPTIPSEMTVLTPTDTTYRIQYINSAADWDIVKNPIFDMPNEYVGTFSYTATLNYIDGNLGAQSKSWTIAATVVELTILNLPLETSYNKSDDTIVSNPPQILYDDDYPGAIWTLVATPSDNSAILTWYTTSTSGGTFNFNADTKVFTVSGTKTQVNAHLNNLYIRANSSTVDFFMNYVLSNNQDASTDTKTQIFKNKDIEYLSNPTQINVLYSEDSFVQITGMPLITDTSYVGLGNYTIAVTPASASAIKLISSNGSGGTVNFDNSTKVYTIVGTKTQVNSHLLALTITPANDFDGVLPINYILSTPSLNSANKLQNLVCNSNDIEITNMNVSRTYVANNENLLFSSDTPFISDSDTDNSKIYTITFNCSFGEWSFDNITNSNPISFSGTRSECDSKFSSLRFYPNVDVSSNGTFTYTQIKQGVTQTVLTVSLNGSPGSYSGVRDINFLVTSTWTPTISDYKYGKIGNLLVVGGGGGGAIGGGGGGQVKQTTDILLNYSTYNITIGTGGTSGNAGTNSSAFEITAVGGGPGVSFNGGYSYAPDGTLYNGGIGTSNPYRGGGGAGSGGAVSRGRNDLNPYTSGDTVRAGNGGIGYLANIWGNTGDSVGDINQPANYGFGGSGQAIRTNLPAQPINGQSGYRLLNPGYENPAITTNFSDSEQYCEFSWGALYGTNSSGTVYINQLAFPADLYINGVRSPEVAGGGGGGGGGKGGDGIVRIKILPR
jgi:hypothetical protein